MTSMIGHFHSFESLAAVDGEGLRCAVFLSGCPLRCVYCHNPDTWQMGEKTIEEDALVRKILRYKPYFGVNGGVTFSGGEPLVQSEFLLCVIPLLQKEHIPFIVDTSGAVALTESVMEVLAQSQSVLLDLKFWNDESYRTYTGQSIDSVLKTLSYLDSVGKKTVIRTVIVPGINDSEEVLDHYLKLLSGYSCITKYELLGFHTMGFFKYDNLGITNPLSEIPALPKERLQELQTYVDSCQIRE